MIYRWRIKTARPVQTREGREAAHACPDLFPGDPPGFQHSRLSGRHGSHCRVLARGALNSCLVEFEDGFRVITSRNYVRRLGRDTAPRRRLSRRGRLEVLRRLHARQGGLCAYCGCELFWPPAGFDELPWPRELAAHRAHRLLRGRRITLDHIRPLIEGGTDDDANLVAACKACNSRKNAGAVQPRGSKA